MRSCLLDLRPGDRLFYRIICKGPDVSYKTMEKSRLVRRVIFVGIGHEMALECDEGYIIYVGPYSGYEFTRVEKKQ